ncbi:uncharacterized protein PRCAT00000893001 [Priceomyces carsonii]|uniref:uncharacterized protein n=1 Tax=Priceomyces carsonii TaxID=28549 RepID=UPI002ED77B79|nr:unnamed protein product [Priceomyces carsonii]
MTQKTNSSALLTTMFSKNAFNEYKNDFNNIIVERVLLPNEVLEEGNEKFLKEFSFEKELSKMRCGIGWPTISELTSSYEPSSISKLGRLLIGHLRSQGIIEQSTQFSDKAHKGSLKPQLKPKRYYCDIDFSVTHGHENFAIKLLVIYEQKVERYNTGNGGAFISNEQLLDYLKAKLVFSKSNMEFDRKVHSMLKIVSVTCHINGLELELCELCDDDDVSPE